MTLNEPSPKHPPRVSVIGLGNVFLGEDAFGPLAVETFRCEYEHGPDIEILDLGTPGMDLAPYLYNRDPIIIIDAVHSDGPKGTLSVFCEEDFVSDRARLRITGHDPGLWESLAHLGLADHAPRELIVIGVAPESCALAEGISPTLLRIASEASATIARLLLDRGVTCSLRTAAVDPNLWWLPLRQIESSVAN
jgi:hydrogenase maturation protease